MLEFKVKTNEGFTLNMKDSDLNLICNKEGIEIEEHIAAIVATLVHNTYI